MKNKYFIKKIIELKNSVKKSLMKKTKKINPKDSFLEYIEIEDFNGNPEFEEFVNQIKNFQGNGIVRFEGADCKTGKIKLQNNDDAYITSFVAKDNSKTKKYIVVKPNMTINSIGNVWEKWGAAKKIFVVEDCPFVINKNSKLHSVINIKKDCQKEINFYTSRNNWIGKAWCEIANNTKLPNIKYTLVVKSNAVLGEELSNIDALIINNLMLPDNKTNTNPIEIINKELAKQNSKIKRLSFNALSKKSAISKKDIQNALHADETLDKFGVKL